MMLHALLRYLRPAAIIGPLPSTLVNGTVADATQVMADLNWIVSQTNANAASGPGTLARNMLYNGAMQLAQRIGALGTLSIAGGTKAYALDRWQVFVGGTNTVTVAQLGVPGLTQFQYAQRVQRNAGSGAMQLILLAQSIESADSYALQGQTVVLSFYARAGANYSPTGNVLGAQLMSGTGTDENVLNGYAGQVIVGYSPVNLVNNWALYQVSGTVPSNATEFGVLFTMAPMGTSGANDYFDITGVQVEFGPSAAAFDFRPLSETLARCQRYYQKSFNISVAPAMNIMNGLVFCYANKGFPDTASFSLPILGSMRLSGTTTLFNPFAANNLVHNQTANADYTSSIGSSSASYLVISANPPAAAAAGDVCAVNWTIDAEL